MASIKEKWLRKGNTLQDNAMTSSNVPIHRNDSRTTFDTTSSPLRYEKDPSKLLRKDASGSSTGSANMPRVTKGLHYVTNLSDLTNDSGMTVDNVTMYCFLATACIGACASGVASPFTVFYAKYFGADDADVGLLQATYSLCAVGMLPVVGKISDKFGRKVALMFCQFVIFAGAGVTTIAPDLQILFIGQFIMSAGITIQTVQEMYIADVTSNQDARKFWYRRFWMADTLPNLIAPPLGGYLGMITLRAPWAMDVTLSRLCMLITYFFVKETPSWLEFTKKEKEAERIIAENSTRRPTLVQRVNAERESRFIIPLVVWFLVADGFFLGTANQGQNAMVSLWQQEKLNFDPVQLFSYEIFYFGLRCVFFTFFLKTISHEYSIIE
jgi:MFS family permease